MVKRFAHAFAHGFGRLVQRFGKWRANSKVWKARNKKIRDLEKRLEGLLDLKKRLHQEKAEGEARVLRMAARVSASNREAQAAFAADRKLFLSAKNAQIRRVEEQIGQCLGGLGALGVKLEKKK